MNDEFIYVFDCPIHGNEHQLLCFRAYNIIDNLDRWRKLQLIEVPMDAVDLETIRKFLESNK